MSDPAYGYTAHLPAVSFEDARSRITDALKQQGFGILTEIDVKATLKAKLNREFRRYVILGACNPQLAHQALEAELGIGLLLPYNVCVWEDDGGSVVSIARPDACGISPVDAENSAVNRHSRSRQMGFALGRCWHKTCSGSRFTEARGGESRSVVTRLTVAPDPERKEHESQ